MNWLDLLLVVIIAASAITSLRKGFSREIIGLVAVIVALMLGAWFYGMAGSFLLPYVSSRWIANFAGFFMVFGGVVILGAAISFGAGRFLKATGLSFFDHLLGALFGVVRGIVVAIAIVMGMMAFSPADHPPSGVVNSRVAPYVVDAARVASAATPYELKEGFRRTYAQVMSAWGKALEKGLHEPSPAKERNERRI
jgi:membrane protein required for colicin V production